MIPQPPPGQGPVDPRGAFTPPPAPPAGSSPASQHFPQPGAPVWNMHAPQQQQHAPGLPPSGYYPPPPPMMMPPPPPYYPPPRRSFGGAILTTLATTIFGMSLALNVYLLLFSGAISTDRTRSEALMSGETSQQIAVYPLRGVIGPEQVALFDKYLTAAEKDANVKAVVLDIDTPGGDVTASDQLYERIRRFKEKKKVPIVVTMGALATSGGYYVSCAADHIFAQQTTITGNIGVLWPRYNVSELAQKWGVKETTIASQSSPFKNAGSMFQPENERDTQYLQGLVDSAYNRFTEVVREGRGSRLRNPDGSTPGKDITQIANGKAYTAAEAVKLGLVDEIGYADDAYAKAAKLANLSNPNVVKYTRTPSFFEAFGATSNLTAPSASSSDGHVTINGLNVNVDRNFIHDLTTPRLMYLWRGE